MSWSYTRYPLSSSRCPPFLLERRIRGYLLGFDDGVSLDLTESAQLRDIFEARPKSRHGQRSIMTCHDPFRATFTILGLPLVQRRPTSNRAPGSESFRVPKTSSHSFTHHQISQHRPKSHISPRPVQIRTHLVIPNHPRIFLRQLFTVL